MSSSWRQRPWYICSARVNGEKSIMAIPVEDEEFLLHTTYIFGADSILPRCVKSDGSNRLCYELDFDFEGSKASIKNEGFYSSQASEDWGGKPGESWQVGLWEIKRMERVDVFSYILQGPSEVRYVLPGFHAGGILLGLSLEKDEGRIFYNSASYTTGIGGIDAPESLNQDGKCAFQRLCRGCAGGARKCMRYVWENEYTIK
jgi:hypothetical protein